ncbi:hypothetical protein H4219_002468 [Mycoemilia scoparia]|uniref:Uncharacterized protein n=1 Tax=Mycoemilia scoparia TaxID=417184 RepID=A0A9W8A153_9FUNG|nr:hypothetical protein H4219_002468 [Mycoemilia scoparia]
MVFATCCIATHLYFTAILNRSKLARKLSRWYELVAWALAIIITQPMFYIYKDIFEISEIQSLVIVDGSKKDIRTKAWLIYVWMALGILWCLAVCTMVVFKLLPIWRRTAAEISFNRPEGSDSHPTENYAGTSYYPIQQSNTVLSAAQSGAAGFNSDGTPKTQLGMSPENVAMSIGKRSDACLPANFGNGVIQASYLFNPTCTFSKKPAYIARRRREIRFMVMRLFLYPLIPIITTPWIIAYHTAVDAPIELGHLCLLMPSLQGIFNFVIFLINPTMDNFWRQLRSNLKEWWASRGGRGSNNVVCEKNNATTVNNGQQPHGFPPSHAVNTIDGVLSTSFNGTLAGTNHGATVIKNINHLNGHLAIDSISYLSSSHSNRSSESIPNDFSQTSATPIANNNRHHHHHLSNSSTIIPAHNNSYYYGNSISNTLGIPANRGTMTSPPHSPNIQHQQQQQHFGQSHRAASGNRTNDINVNGSSGFSIHSNHSDEGPAYKYDEEVYKRLYSGTIIL